MDCASGSVSEGMTVCPFLKSYSSSFPQASVPGGGNPLFQDGPNFDLAFKLFHGQNGVKPLSTCHVSNASPSPAITPRAVALPSEPIGLCMASISLSAFGPFGPFGYMNMKSLQAPQKQPEQKREEKKRQPEDSPKNEAHEASGNEWLATGNCPIAKSYRAISKALPLIASVLKPPSNVVYKCPPAIVAMRAALAKHPTMKALRPQVLPVKVMAIGMMGFMLNIPMGVWREHCEKFSPQWILAVHASVPLVAMLRKAALMPKYAMAFTIAASIIGQTVGARLEKARMKKGKAELLQAVSDPSRKIHATSRELSSLSVGNGEAGHVGKVQPTVPQDKPSGHDNVLSALLGIPLNDSAGDKGAAFEEMWAKRAAMSAMMASADNFQNLMNLKEQEVLKKNEPTLQYEDDEMDAAHSRSGPASSSHDFMFNLPTNDRHTQGVDDHGNAFALEERRLVHA